MCDWHRIKTSKLVFLNLIWFCHSKIFIEISKFWVFLKQTLSQIFWVWSCCSKISHWNCIIQKFSENKVVSYFPFLKWFLWIKKSYFLFLSLVMQQRNIAVNFPNFIIILKWVCRTKTLLKSCVDSNVP